MTTFTLFRLLSKQEQAEMLQQEGTYLCTRQEPEFLVDLYELEDFYVETFRHRADCALVLVKSYRLQDLPEYHHQELCSPLTIAWKNPFSFDANCGPA